MMMAPELHAAARTSGRLRNKLTACGPDRVRANRELPGRCGGMRSRVPAVRTAGRGVILPVAFRNLAGAAGQNLERPLRDRRVNLYARR